MDNSGPRNSAKYCAANAEATAALKFAINKSNSVSGKPPIYTLSDEELAGWKAELMPVWDRWANELEARKLPGNAIIADVKALTSKYSSEK